MVSSRKKRQKIGIVKSQTAFLKLVEKARSRRYRTRFVNRSRISDPDLIYSQVCVRIFAVRSLLEVLRKEDREEKGIMMLHPAKINKLELNPRSKLGVFEIIKSNHSQQIGPDREEKNIYHRSLGQKAAQKHVILKSNQPPNRPNMPITDILTAKGVACVGKLQTPKNFFQKNH